MEMRLIKSGIVVITALTMAVSGTYAAFTSNPVTISASTLSTGGAAIKLCQLDTGGSHTWVTTISPSLTLANLAPAANTSDPGQELTLDKNILLGNDGGTLSACTYGEAASSSNVALRILPVVTSPNCSAAGMDGQLELRVILTNSDGTADIAESDWKTLLAWTTNTSVMDQIGVSTDFAMPVNQSQRVKIAGRLKSTAPTTTQGQSCTFNVVLTGQQ